MLSLLDEERHGGLKRDACKCPDQAKNKSKKHALVSNITQILTTYKEVLQNLRADPIFRSNNPRIGRHLENLTASEHLLGVILHTTIIGGHLTYYSDM